MGECPISTLDAVPRAPLVAASRAGVRRTLSTSATRSGFPHAVDVPHARIDVRSQRPRHGGTARRLISDIVHADDDLAIGYLAQGPRILVGNANRAAPWLGQSGIVQHQEAVRRTLRHQGGHALLIEGLGLPGRIGQ